MSDLANLSVLHNVISEVGTRQVVALLQLFRLRKGKISSESKDGVVYVYQVSQKLLNITGYKLIELYQLISCINDYLKCSKGYAVAQLVEALRYKSEGRGFNSRWCHWNFSLT